MLAYATRVVTQYSEALLAVPHATARQLEDAGAEEQERLYPVMPQLLKLCDELLSASDDWLQHQTKYEARRPKNRVARALRMPALGVHRD